MEDNHIDISDLGHFISRVDTNGAPFHPYQQQQQQYPPLLTDLMTAHHLNDTMIMGRHVGINQPQHHRPLFMESCGGVSDESHYYKNPHFNFDVVNTNTNINTITHGNYLGGFDGGDGGTARWPRQETLNLLEIRSKLDHMFKDAIQKGPLWDEVARIMYEEHGYQRSGKKCREKFENLYKYYKKTKEGKAGRQDGKNYRFFRQLEALYGEHHPPSTSVTHIAENAPQLHTHCILPESDNTTQYHQSALSLKPNNRDCDPSVSQLKSKLDNSSDDNDVNGSMESDETMDRKKRKGYKSWKTKTKEYVDVQMRKVMEKQECWVEKMMKTIESRENERMIRSEEWMKKEVERVEKERKFWANERVWIETRELTLMAALEKLSNKTGSSDEWPENEVIRLVQVRTSMESRFQQCGLLEDVLWGDIATKMACLGYDRSAIVCKEKWYSLNNNFQEKSMINKGNYGGVNLNHHHVHNSYNHNEVGINMNHLGGFSNCEINESRLQLNEVLPW